MNEQRKPTEFEMAVYELVRGVPPGQVTSYGSIARRLGRGTARAVGTALAKNPFVPEVPCHRVVRADGALGGFNGFTGGPELARKQALLTAESVPFLPSGKVAPTAITS